MEITELSSKELVELHQVIGRNVANIRKAHGISQLDLALSIGYKSASVIAKAEAGTEGRHFSIEQLYKISEALQINIIEFFTGVSKRVNMSTTT